MLIGLDCYGDDTSCFDTLVAINKIYKMQLQNIKIDAIKVDEDGTLPYSSAKEEWGYTTVMKTDFANTLEAGNIDMQGIPIEYIKFRRRTKDTLVWQDVALFPFDQLQQFYTFTDNIVKSTEIYEYAIVPLTATVQGKETIAEIDCEFEGCWLVEKDIAYKLLYNLSYGDIENVMEDAVLQPFSQYPIIASSPVDYHRSSITAMIPSDTSVNTGKIDAREERLMREKILKFLKDRKPKILKDGAGRFYLVRVMNPKEQPINELTQRIVNVSFDWTEIGDTDEQTLKNNGLL